MPDKRTTRGPHPADAELFGPGARETLARATSELSWLLERGYPEAGALELVGNRHALRSRQRIAVSRCAAGQTRLGQRVRRRVPADDLSQRSLWIDGFNVIVSLESALDGAVLLRGLDGCVRDLAAVQGSYRIIGSTGRALELVTATLDTLNCAQVRWLLDAPVSNSGRLAARLREMGTGRPWQVETVADPDVVLLQNEAVVASADRRILDGCGPWFDLVSAVLQAPGLAPWMVDLSGA